MAKTRDSAMATLVQPNSWSCLPTAAAIMFNVSLDTLLRIIGHDGSLCLWPALPEPMCRRGFHPQEIIEAGIKLGYPCAWLDMYPMLEQEGNAFLAGEEALLKKQFFKHSQSECVLIGTGWTHRHAWAVTEKGIIDPSLGIIEDRASFFAKPYKLESLILKF